MLRHTADAEDAAQEALIRIWRHGPIDPAPAWRATVSRNEALRFLERRRRLPSPADPATLESQLATEWEQLSVNAVDVGQLLTGLAPADRQLLNMRYLEDLTQPEIARQLGIPEGTVKVRLHRLRARLRERAGSP